ncbi:MAG: bifunctional phosphopantothenoylcysteine decarboxylase/phosphopantothenate--cysteine ligase CoaBC [Candidatus Eremiobacteraeota bacterium]|nr:bifunctional phosphopantothenoylcysteine decarboxylase/phosphopantothenate--cysteine ligase CoaBC [Candidatus Eremiobacteraeota bacterium]
MDYRMKGARILLGVTGGIAAYKAAALTSTLVQAGAIVDVILTAHAERFISALTFSSLTARPVYTSLWDAPERIPHIRLVREAEVCLVAPATANFISKLASGAADDLLSTALLAARIPVVVAPAMNSAMYENSATQAHLAVLRERGIHIVDPESGFLAERESGAGRLASEERLIDALMVARALDGPLRGKRVAITAGPTREPIDPVRHLSNASTGAMGIALAREAARRGAEVTLILGPTLLSAPECVRTIHVGSAQELYDAALLHARGADITIATAAVSDWRPAQQSPEKIKKTEQDLTVRMVRNPDTLAALGAEKGTTYVVGFAAETQMHEAHAREKLRNKNLDAIAVNDVGGQRAFGVGENTLTVLFADGSRAELGTHPKAELAARLWDALIPRMESKA